MSSTCPLCRSHRIHPALAAPDFHLGRTEEYEVWACDRCGLGHTRPPLTASELAAAYPAHYACYHLQGRPARGWRGQLAASMLKTMGYRQEKAAALPGFLARMLARVRGWTWLPPPPPPGRLLDVGCGSGAYGASLIRLGWRVDGVEPDAEAARRAQEAGLNVKVGGIMEVDLPPAHYNAATMWHVLEHLDEPVAALKRVRSALKPNGLLMVETPNWGGWTARLMGRYWYHLDLPRHRLHFTTHSLRLAVIEAGFRVERLEHIPNGVGPANSVAYRLKRGPNRSHLLLILGWVFGVFAAAFGQSDVIRVIARK